MTTLSDHFFWNNLTEIYSSAVLPQNAAPEGLDQTCLLPTQREEVERTEIIAARFGTLFLVPPRYKPPLNTSVGERIVGWGAAAIILNINHAINHLVPMINVKPLSVTRPLAHSWLDRISNS